MSDELEIEGGFEPQKSGPCLIAGFHQLFEGRLTYFHPYGPLDGNRVSVDMVRLDLSFTAEQGERLRSMAQTFDAQSAACYIARRKPGSWYELWTYEFEVSSVSLGIGFFEKNSRLNMTRGFLEFNPNKVCCDQRFERLLESLSHYASDARLVRFDLAYDVTRKRSDCRVSKDRRLYKCVISGGVTEYLGQKNVPGYVKVYDKSCESKLPTELTRIELTCDGNWTADDVLAHWPQVHQWSKELTGDAPSRKTAAWVSVVAKLLAERAESGREIESFIDELDWKQKGTVRDLLRTGFVKLPKSFAQVAIAEAQTWCSRVAPCATC